MPKPKYQNIIIIVALFGLSFIYYKAFILANTSLLSQLRGKILLQVENKGEAWYIPPISEERHYLGRPSDAFSLMKNLGIGISNENIKMIPIADSSFSGPDSDGDGLSDLFEDAIATDKNKIDTDGDSFDDKTEILSNFNPSGAGKIQVDEKFAKRLAGNILIQAEQNGEAWYVNPSNNQRYFLGRPSDAFAVMRKTGLGISNNDLENIAIYSPAKKNSVGDTEYASTGKRKYVDKYNKYSFEYPDSWDFRHAQGNANVVFIHNYKNDIIEEKKARITMSFIKVNERLELNRFKTASKDNATKEVTETKTINEFETLKEKYKLINIESEETNIFIQLSDQTMIMISAFSAGNHEVHDRVLDDVLRSVKVVE